MAEHNYIIIICCVALVNKETGSNFSQSQEPTANLNPYPSLNHLSALPCDCALTLCSLFPTSVNIP